MTRHAPRPLAVSLLLAIVLSASAPSVRGAIPGAENPKAFTEHDLLKAKLDYNKRTLSHAYTSNGKTDPKWDAAAVKFLDEMAIRFSNAGVEDWYRLPGEKTSKQLLDLADAAIALGCADPLVTYCRAVILHDENRTSPAQIGPIIEAAATEMFAGRYPVNRALAAQGRLHRITGEQHAERRAEIWKGWQELAVALVVHWKYQSLDRRIVFDTVWDDVMQQSAERRVAFVADVMAQEQACDPWMKHMIAGANDVRLAWEARGGGYAGTVTPQGWKGFAEHLRKARENLVAAHALHPDYPEAATAMMEVALGAGDETGDTMREWFDKATAAQLDYPQAYSKLLWSLRPRWGGSHEQMYAFGVECLDTKRFDTRVPNQFMIALHDIAHDSDGGSAFYKRAGVYEDGKAFFAGTIAHLRPAQDADHLRSYHAAFAWRTGRFAEARELLDALGARFNERVFLNFNVMGRLAASHAYAMRDPIAAQVSAAEQQAAAGDVPGAAAAYEKAVAALTDPSDRAGYYLRSRLKQLQWQQEFDAGGWVDIKPDKEFIGWQPLNGSWTFEPDGTVVGAVDARGCWMICQAPTFNRDLEIEMTLDLPPGVNSAGGVAFTHPSDLTKYWGQFVRRTRDGAATFNRDFTPPKRDPVEFRDGPNTFRLLVRGNRITGTFNDAEIFRDDPVTYIFDLSNRYLGIGNRQTNAGSSFRLIALRVRAVD